MFSVLNIDRRIHTISLCNVARPYRNLPEITNLNLCPPGEIIFEFSLTFRVSPKYNQQYMYVCLLLRLRLVLDLKLKQFY